MYTDAGDSFFGTEIVGVVLLRVSGLAGSRQRCSSECRIAIMLDF